MNRERQLDQKEMALWKVRVGGFKNAARMIKEKLDCSQSKSDKLAGGNYPSLPTPAEQLALAELMNRPRDVVFRPVGASRKRLTA